MDVTVWYDPDIDSVVAAYRGRYTEPDATDAVTRVRVELDEHTGAGLIIDARGLDGLPDTSPRFESGAPLVPDMVTPPRSVAALSYDADRAKNYVRVLSERGMLTAQFVDFDDARQWSHEVRPDDAARLDHDDSLQGA